jgi:choline dehydrogenase-like flavoprotein
MTQDPYDAIVIGSGISGGWAAKELTEGGLRVLLLERGENIEHITGYVNALKAPWEFPHRNRMTTALRAAHIHDVREDNAPLAVDDRESPYVQIKPYTWYRGYHVGGRSLMWGRQSYRWSDFDFEANQREGVGVDWPIRYADLAPWYDYVEGFAGISGSAEGLAQLPDGKFLPPMELTCVEKAVAARIRARYGGARRLIIGRVANLTEPHNGRTNCQYRNKCDLGCPFGAYFSTQSSTLPAAVKTGRLTLRPYSIVTRILYDRDAARATGVEVLDAQTRQTLTFTSRIVFLCASTLNSAWVLMNSATDVWPDGLGSRSGELGHNLMDHQSRAGASGRVEGFEDRYLYGRRANGFYVPRFRNLFGDRRGYLRGFGYQGGSGRGGWEQGVAELGVGAAMKQALTEPGPWAIGMATFGEILPNHANRISVDRSTRDAWGLPVLAIDCATGENERRMRVDMINDAAEILEAAGVKDVATFDMGYHFGQSSHEMGAARMGRDPRTSVLNGHNQVWDARNVLVTDGACMASASCVNPSLTYMALTARAARFAIDALKRGDL